MCTSSLLSELSFQGLETQLFPPLLLLVSWETGFPPLPTQERRSVELEAVLSCARYNRRSRERRVQMRQGPGERSLRCPSLHIKLKRMDTLAHPPCEESNSSSQISEHTHLPVGLSSLPIHQPWRSLLFVMTLATCIF